MPKNDAETVRWFGLSADQGFAEAQYDLGVRYVLGRGVARNERAGLELYRRAARQGYAEAVEALRRRGLRP